MKGKGNYPLKFFFAFILPKNRNCFINSVLISSHPEIFVSQKFAENLRFSLPGGWVTTGAPKIPKNFWGVDVVGATLDFKIIKYSFFVGCQAPD